MRFRCAAPLLFAVGFVCVCNAQVAARLTGLVVDSTGGAVASASVDVLLPGGERPILSMSTTAEGIFAFSAIPAGTYDVIITAKGFRKAAERGVVLAAGAETSMPTVHLEVGGTTEVIEVKENAETVQTTNSEISTNVGRNR